jgi:hypothetical protein
MKFTDDQVDAIFHDAEELHQVPDDDLSELSLWQLAKIVLGVFAFGFATFSLCNAFFGWGIL